MQRRIPDYHNNQINKHDKERSFEEVKKYNTIIIGPPGTQLNDILTPEQQLEILKMQEAGVKREDILELIQAVQVVKSLPQIKELKRPKSHALKDLCVVDFTKLG